MSSIFQDVRYGLRSLLRSPVFTVVAVATLALGIGVNTAIFSVVNAVLLRELPYTNPDHLVAVWETSAQPGQDVNHRNEVAMGNFLDWRTQQTVFDGLASLNYSNVNLTGSAEPERIQGAVVTTNFFSLLGANPIIGRGFLADEEDPDSVRTILISQGLWQRRFGSDPDVIGKTLTVNGNPAAVIGILPSAFQFEFPITRQIEIWMPMRISASNANRQSHYLYVIGRLRSNVSVDRAQAGMTVLANQLQQQYPETNSNRSVNLIPLQQQIVGDTRPYLRVLFAAVGFVLLIACANVACLLVARVNSRYREIAIRAALGATRWRIIRQLLTESILLAGVGGLAGLLLSVWLIEMLVRVAPTEVPRLDAISTNGQVLAWTLIVSLATGVLFGIAPALGASKSELNESLKEGGRSVTDGRSRLRNVLVISEIALAFMLLIGAGLLIKSFVRLHNVSPGFASKDVLTMNVSLPRQKYKENKQINSFFEQLITKVSSIPEVEVVGGIDPLPFGGSDGTTGFVVEGESAPPVGERPEVGERTATSNYFRAMGIPVIKGRSFNNGDREDAPRAVIINEALAQRFWPNVEALGKRLGFKSSDPQVWHEIVGIVGNIRHRRLDAAPKPELYFPYSQYPETFMSLVVRTSSEPINAIAAIRNQVLSLDPDQPIFDIKTMDERLAISVAVNRFVMLLIGVFAALATMLAAVGIYGVMAYTVSQRTHEIGVRMALGAGAHNVIRLVMAHGFKLVVSGMGIGIAGALALSRVIESLLFEVSTTDPMMFAIISAVVATVAVLSCFLPAYKAVRIDPMIALRYE